MKEKKSLVLLFFLLIIFLVFTFPNCKGKKIERIILITIDTLRSDHLGCYGYPRNTSPFIDSLAEKGILFTNVFTTMPSTTPAHASLFTSKFPKQLNVLKNGHILDEKYLTMAEYLQKLDYFTAGIVSTNIHFKLNKLDQGFNYFYEPGKSMVPKKFRLKTGHSMVFHLEILREKNIVLPVILLIRQRHGWTIKVHQMTSSCGFISLIPIFH
jgi:arylsulfatase A-like enzyme